MERIALEEAQSRLTEALARALPTESVALTEALNRVLAEDIRASVDQPPFDRSPLDGYALRSADLAQIPVTLPVTQRIHAGDAPAGPLAPGTAARRRRRWRCRTTAICCRRRCSPTARACWSAMWP